jgi:hypothetical protein
MGTAIFAQVIETDLSNYTFLFHNLYEISDFIASVLPSCASLKIAWRS